MGCQGWWGAKWITAYVSLALFISAMRPLMCCQVRGCTKWLLTHVTLVWFLSSMSPFVYCQIAWLIKCLLTNITLVRFVASMSHLVCCQIARLPKRLITHIALERSVSSVNPCMARQSRWLTKCLTTEYTTVWSISRISVKCANSVDPDPTARVSRAVGSGSTLFASLSNLTWQWNVWIVAYIRRRIVLPHGSNFTFFSFYLFSPILCHESGPGYGLGMKLRNEGMLTI